MTCDTVWYEMQKGNVEPLPHFYMNRDCEGNAFVPEIMDNNDVLLSLPSKMSIKSWVIPENMDVQVFDNNDIDKSQYGLLLEDTDKIAPSTDLIISPWQDLGSQSLVTQKAGLDYARSALVKVQMPFQQWKSIKCDNKEWPESVCLSKPSSSFDNIRWKPLDRLTEEWPLLYQVIALVSIALIVTAFVYFVYKYYFASSVKTPLPHNKQI